MPADNIYDALRESHQLQRSLCRQLVRASDDSEKRNSPSNTTKIINA